VAGSISVKLTVLVGGIGGARFLLGCKQLLGLDPFGPAPADHPHSITAIVNTADDIRLHGLQVSPDLDSCMYTLGGGADLARGWGRADETFATAAELRAYDAEAPWFGLGDRDIATHLVRTRMLDAGYPLSAVTAALCRRWEPGVELLPMSDDRVETHVVVEDPETPAEGAVPRPLVALHFQEWWIRYQAGLPAQSITPIGADTARPGPGVLAAIAEADLVLIAPSNPVVSIGPILAVPGIRDAVRETSAKVVGVSPIIGGRVVRGMADVCLTAIGVETSAAAVARHYAARSADGVLDAWLLAEEDAPAAPVVEAAGIRALVAPLWMRDEESSAAIAEAALGA
jgi:LPPG:FO 2-phospho-L-lactate transferase